MEKDFDAWNIIQNEINKKNPYLVKERGVYWCYLGKNIGFEHNGSGDSFSRPVLVLKKLSRYTCLIVPLTTSTEKHKYRFFIGGESSVVLSQIRVIDTRRITERIFFLSREKFETIKKSIKEFL